MTKRCNDCGTEIHMGYRIQKESEKLWIFVCGKCCLSAKKGTYYRYGGTWKSKEKRLGSILEQDTIKNINP